MCGIFASVGFAPKPECIHAVKHRGPDGFGWREFPSIHGPICLGHRRLSIIDLDVRSAQPMSCADQRYWLTFNGEIYNYVELKQELVNSGVRFRTESDSEVLLQGYIKYGEKILDKLRGMFAFAIFDLQSSSLFVARDRFGIKPLYFFQCEKGVAFGSEIKQFLLLPEFSKAINIPRTFDYLRSGITDHTCETMFRDAKQLQAGQYVHLDLRTWSCSRPLPIKTYYEAKRGAELELSEREAVEFFRERFEESVQLHLRSDVRVGSCLSGGLDSSSIVMLVDRLLSTQSSSMHTVSACYEEKSVDEKPYMDAVIRSTNVTPHFIYPHGSELENVANIVTWHQDEPFGSTSIFAQWFVFAEANRQSIKVMLDGQGADEQLAGYPHPFFEIQTHNLFGSWQFAKLLRQMVERRKYYGESLWQQALAIPNRPRLPKFLRRQPDQMPGERWLSSAACESLPSDDSPHSNASDGVSDVRGIGDLCIRMLTRSSLPMLLRYEDRNSMAHAVEARVPFLDHKLVEFTVGLWNSHKIVGGETKHVLRESMKGLLPEQVRKRHDKLGFATPEIQWLRGPLRQMAMEKANQTLDIFPNLFNSHETHLLVDRVLRQWNGGSSMLWRLINLGIWGNVFGLNA